MKTSSKKNNPPKITEDEILKMSKQAKIDHKNGKTILIKSLSEIL